MNKSTKTVLLTGAGFSASKYPVKSHMAIVQLMKQGKISHLITSNNDGLHKMSGIPSEQLSELNGNTKSEYCNKCGHVYNRDFNVRKFTRDLQVLNMGRVCDK